MHFFNYDSGCLLEARQTDQDNIRNASREAEMYTIWAEYHYRCEVTYKIKEKQ